MPFLLVITWPFLEAWVTGDKREHHVLQRPRNAPTRTAFLAATISAYGLLWAAGGNDILATRLHLSLNGITYAIRGAIFVVPPVVFAVTRRWCLGLQRADNDRLVHGDETGIIVRSADGGYSERHRPVSPERALRLRARPAQEVRTSGGVRARLSRAMFADDVPLPPDQDEPPLPEGPPAQRPGLASRRR